MTGDDRAAFKARIAALLDQHPELRAQFERDVSAAAAVKALRDRLSELQDIATQAQDAADASRDPGEVGYARGLRNAVLVMRGEAGGEGLAP